MGIPLDSDWNDIESVFVKIEDEMIDADKADKASKQPKQAKGGTFAPADIPVIKRALHFYLIDCLRTEGYSDRDPHPDVAPIANLLHRLGRIA